MRMRRAGVGTLRHPALSNVLDEFPGVFRPHKNDLQIPRPIAVNKGTHPLCNIALLLGSYKTTAH